MSASRDSGLWPQVLGLDARVLIFFLVFFLHWRLWTFLLFVLVTAFFWVLKRFGISLTGAYGTTLWWLGGKHRRMNVNESRFYDET